MAATFVGHIKADRYQEAYDMTSPAFRACITKKQFEEFCSRHHLLRAHPEILEPDRTKYPSSPDSVGICEGRVLPFSIVVFKDENGHWVIDAVIMENMDDKRLRQMEGQWDEAK
jgi:hypothetical protein